MLQKKTVQLDIPDTKYHNANIRIKRLCPGCNLNRLEERIIVCLKHSLPWIQRKAPLQTLDFCRRCRQALYKLKADLQNLGLSRRQVHQGLIQLATKPRVVLTRQIPYRRYRFKNLSENEREKNIIDNLRTNALNLRPRIEDIYKSNKTERFIKEESKYIKKADGVKAHETALISSNRELFIPNICYKLKNPLATMHSFDETLKQLDKSISSKMRVDEKSTNTRKLENNVVSSKKCDKDENHHCNRKHKDTQKIREIPNLISDEVGSNRTLMFNKYKKKRIEPKLKLNSCFAKKVSDSIKSDDYKEVYTKSIKLDNRKKLHNDKKLIDMKVNSIPDKNIYSKHEDSTLNRNHNTEEVTKMRENTHKRKLRKLLVSDKHKEIIKKKRKIKDRLRTYFGDCLSISEDEQEQNIIEERFRKTRKKDSVDSCESGVYVAERNITMTAAHVDIIEKSNEDTSQGIIANVDETIVNVDTNYGLNEDTSQRTIVNAVIHESNEDTSQGIIANVDTNHKSNEGTSQGTIANIIQKSDEDTSQGTILNVNVIHESNEDISQGIIANVDTSHKSNEDTSQSTIANIIQKPDEDTSQGTIVNVDTIHESNEVKGNTNNKTTNQIEGATNFVEIECNKLRNNTYENKTHNIEIEKKELSRNKFINFSEKNNIEKSKHASSVTDIFQITEQSKVNVSTTKKKATTEINNILPSDIPEICISSHDTVAISKDFSGSEKSNSDTKDFNDLLHMRLFKTCQIGSNRNVLSIQEIDMNADVGESSNLKKLSEIQINSNQSITERRLNHTEENKKVQLSSNTNKTDNVISTNNISNVKNNENELAVKNSELNISEKKDIQSNKLPQGKLRVLSSAELGARWCPTPVNSVTSTVVQFSHKNTETETAVSIPAPVSETASRTTIPENMKKYYMDLQLSKSVYVILVKIHNLIQNIRISPITNLNYDKLLTMELQKLRKMLNIDDFIDLTNGVVSMLNKNMSVIPPLSLNELFCYAPSVKSYYVPILNKNKTTINNLNECRTVKSVGVPNQITLNQNRCDAQVSQNIWASPVQSKLQYLLSISSEQGQTLCLNIVPNQPQQNFQEQIVLPLQNNVLQSNVLVNPNIVNNNSHNNNMHQHTYRMQVHANFTQQKVSNVNFAKQNPVTNMHARQSYPLLPYFPTTSYSLFPPTGRNQLGGVHTSVPLTNASSINQQYVSSVFIPQSNTYCNVNVPNYTIQQNMNSTHMSQGTQLQGVLRSVSPNRNIPQPVQQNMNSTHMSQGTQLQGVSRSVSPNRNIPQPAQQNMNSTHMSQGTRLQGVSRSISSNRNIPQPVQTMVATNISHPVPKNSQHIEQKHKKIIPQKRIPMEVLQNRTSEQVASSQQLKKSTLRRLKKKENLQVSLESTTNLFDILKYISDIQKLILLKQLDYYFGCTTWLQQQFTSEKWQEIHSERSVLLYFQTLLKHLVEKTIKNLLPDNYQTNILKNIEIDVPKVIQITVKENNGICCQVEASESNQEQHNAMNIKQNCTNYEENSNVTITQNQREKEHEATDNSQTNSSLIKQNLQSHQTSDVDVCQENKVEREPNSSRNIHNSNTKEQNLDESKKITENIPQVVKEKLSALPNMKLLDTLLQLNPHLVTVEISSKNDQVTVVDTNANSENTPKSEEPEEYQEHQHLKGTITDDLTVSSFKSPNNIEYFNNKESHNTSLERPPTNYIKDVRSISMEAYLRIGVTNNVPANTMEENIEEEEIKICLYCGKPSTVACIICLEAKYCSKECSQLHWGDHYKDCSPVERSISS
ncbi:protein PF3D7_1417600-like [Bombus flavifrons]|uniref:protein PF3D7_1417600-like n=1 Tax=Bombus flavifrons TaxID=103934 RepID=UPI0037048202